ncbi:hypothetical protein Aperf_G00000067393 [Anoplocephala perfoliata]
MVPFPPQGLQIENYRQHRPDLVYHPKANDQFSTSTPMFYNCNCNPHWNTGQPHMCPERYGEHYYQPSPGPLHTSYLTPAVTGLNAQVPAFPLAPSREGSTSQPTYCSSNVSQEMKCNSFGLPNCGFDYNPICQMPPSSHTLVYLDISTDVQRRTISPNSTQSSSDIGSVGFNSDEQICIPSTAEPDIISPEFCEVPSNGNVIGNTDEETRTKNGSTDQSKAEKDLERRRKNNEASRKSRAQRRDRFLMEMKEVEFLKTENVRLRGLLKEVELAIKEANDTLIAKFQYQLPSNQPPTT